MCVKYFYRWLLIVAGFMLAVCVNAQELPVSDYNELPGPINAGVVSEGVVCPSLDSDKDGTPEVASLSTFRLSAYDAAETDLGQGTDNIFEWVVYGGWITGINGAAIVVADHANSQQRTSIGNIRYSYVSVIGVANPAEIMENWEAYIEVEWDTTNFSTVNGWVAVKHSNEWNCSDGNWSVITNTIDNTPPVFVEADFPEDIRLPDQLKNNYTLPLPAVSDEGCNQTPFLSYKLTLPDATEISNDENNRLVNLQTGNNVVEWTVSDGSLTATRSYTITVEPVLEILNVAWTQPTCDGATDGALLVTGLTAYSFLGDVEFSFNGGAYSTTDNINGLAAGVHTIDARIIYTVDSNNDEVDESYTQQAEATYTATLTANAATAVDAVPLEGPNAIVTNTDCQNSATGRIRVSSEVMVPQNHSVNFDGDDYLLLNKQYNAAMNAFTVATWIKVPSAGITEGTLLSFDNEQYFQLSLVYFSLSGVTRVRLQTNSEEGVFVHTTPINDDEWHLVVATYSNGDRSLYIDGEVQQQTASMPLQVGNGSEARYGMIGAASKTATFFADPQPNFFKGDMAEMAIWDGVSLSSADIDNMMKNGMSGMSDHWVLNSTPVNVSATRPDVFTDLGNTVNTANWARFFNGSRSDNNAPWLLSWTDDVPATIDADYEAGDELLGLGVGNYTLHVKDILACGESTATYEVENSDALQPELFWNAALGKTASQLQTSGSNFASLAVDGFGATNPAASSSETGSTNDVWWEVDLEGIFPIRMIRIHSASDFSNFYVMASQSPFNAASTLVEDLARVGDTRVQYPGAASGSTTIMLTANARYIRIRASGTASLHLAEVEVMTNMTPVPPRILNMGSGSCEYTITDDEFSIAPVAYDVCDGITSFTNTENGGTDLIGVQFTLGDHPVTWTATDDVPLSGNLDINYRVVDETPAEFFPLPFANGTQTITYCQSQSYNLPIPKISDNYPLSCGDLTSLELYSDVFRAYQYSPIADYDPAVDEMTGNLDYENYLRPGDHVLEWRVKDHSENLTTDPLNLHVELEPRVLEVKTSPITCNGANNAQVTFSQIESEQDVNPAVDVIYVLKSTVAPFDELPRQTNNPVFNNVPVGTYHAFIEVNTCVSNNYYEVISVSEPAAITLTEEISPVRCSGEANGGIVLTVSGGSQTNILHLLGGDSQGASAANYAAINLAGEGSIEGWIYLDELGSAPGEVNYNAGLFGVLDGAGQGYGLRMSNGVLTFYAGAESVQANAVDIQARNWYHVAGSWDEANTRIDLTINASVAYNAAIPGAFDAPDGGAVYFGELADADDSHVLRGFVRNVRIWNTAITTTDMANNFYLLDPIDASGSLMANYPLAAGGGTVLQNRAPNSTSANVTTANYAWQKFAFYWENSSGVFVARTKDISAQVADDYTVTLDDPMACAPVSETFTININDTYRPVMTFSNEGYGGAALSVGEPIRRFTDDINADVRNVAGDCVYYPAALEFDPVVEDDVCPEEDVVLTFEVLSGAFDAASVPAADAATLDGSAMTDEMRIRWTATDPAGNSRTAEVNYYIIDDEAPVLAWSDQVRETDADDCGYTVTAADVNILPTLTENCSSGRLYNNINGLATLEGEYFEPGTYTIRWTYDDKQFPGPYFAAQSTMVEQTLTVEDNQVPQAACKAPFTVQLNASGSYTIDNLDVDNGSDDNCGLLSAIHITKNVAYGLAATQSGYENGVCFADDAANAAAALDGNTSNTAVDCSSSLTSTGDDPWWQVNLGALNTLYGIRLYSSDAAILQDFWVLVSNDGSFSNSGDWTEAGASFGPDVVYSQYVAGPVALSQDFFFDHAIMGSHVQIRMNGSVVQLSLAEVEVYGTIDAVNATSLLVGCDDVRYKPGPNPLVQDGTFNPIGVLLSAIDNDDNITSCLTEVTVEDNVAPIVIAKSNITIYLDDSGEINFDNSTMVQDQFDNGSNDVCGVDSFWLTPDLFTCLNLGTRVVDLYVRDLNGNVAREQVPIAIGDNRKPNMNTQNNIRLVLGDDGTYTINPRTDIDDGTSYDNCTPYGSLIFNTVPAVVDCDDIGTDVPIQFSIRDLQGNDSIRTVIVEVADDDGPTAVLNDFELTIQSDNTGVIEFRDIIADASLRDNCTTDFTARKFISYNVSGNWCAAGDEGSAAASAFTNIANLSSVTGSTHYDTYIADNIIDNNLGTSYISDATAGERELILTFPQEYEFNRADVRWHEEILISEVALSTNRTYLPFSNIYTNDEYGPLPAINSADGSDNINNRYENDTKGSNGIDERWVEYEFSQPMILTRTSLRWVYYDWGSGERVRAPATNNYSPTIEYYNGSTWTSIATLGTSTSNYNNATFANDLIPITRLRVRFDLRNNSYAGIREWYVYGYPAPREYDCELPVSPTRLQWYNGGVWTDVTPATGYSNIGLLDSDDNRLDFSSVIQTDRFRLLVYGDDRRIGVEELRLYGREIAAGNACIGFDCTDVGTEIPVYLMIVDEQGTSTEFSTIVPVKPYFSIDDIQIYDCGVSGEVYTPAITGMDLNLTYDYLWTTITRPSPFDWTTTPFDNSGSYSLTSTNRTPTVHNDGGYMRAGDYVVNFNVQDENECYADYEYSFYWRSDNGGGADSEKEDSICIDQSRTYNVTPPPINTYWDGIDYTWTKDAEITLTGGGGIGDDWASFEFPNAGTYEINMTLVGYQRNIYSGPVILAAGQTVSCSSTYPCRIVASHDPNILDGTWYNSNQYFPAGTEYVRTYQNAGWYECREGVNWTIDIYDVPAPVFQAYDATICLLDTITYTIDATQQAVFDHYSWSWTHGRRYLGGNASDPFITIIWDDYEDLSYYPAEKPSVTVVGYNQLNCSDQSTIEMDYSGSAPPSLDCSGKDLIHANTPGASCSYTFQNIEAPVMTDDCDDRIESFYNDFTNGINAAAEYPLGITTVTWYASDYNGNENSCSHTITVLDTEPPAFSAPPSSDKRDLSANEGCNHRYSGTNLDMTASDHCSLPVTITWTIYRDIDGDDIYTDVEASGLNTLDGYLFSPGRSRVEWTATDAADNNAYLADGFSATNSIITEYFVSVTDNTKPTFDPLAAVNVANDPDQCSATLVIAPPGSAEIDDNCSLDAALVVEFTGRDDGEDELSDPFPVGTTTLTWRVTDEEGNYATATQQVTVTDTQEPWFDNDDAGVDGDPVDPALVDRSIGYCMAAKVKLPIPEPFDNCLVDRIDWTVVNNGGTAYSASGFITRAQSANFNPNGDDSTSVIPALPVDDESGSDYTVTWTVTDAAGNLSSESYTYNLHVEMEPYFNLLEATEMSCGDADDGKITMVTTGLYRVEPGYDVHYTIDNWESHQVNNPIFEGLTGGTYNVQMRVNGCYSGVSQATITQPEVYDIVLTATHPYCYEATDGSIDMTMSGGVAGQVHFTGGAGLTALHYTELDLTSSGSIEAWVYLESLDDVTLLAKGSDYALKLLGGKFTIQVGPAYLGDAANEGAGIAPALRRWYYVAASWEVGTGMKLSVNDAAQGGSIQGGALVNAPVNSSNVSIGNNFEGIIREARIWSTVVDGFIPSSKYTGSEAGLEAFWPLDDGAGNDAANSCVNKNENATDAAGASSLWDATQPQPGTYTWTKDGAFYSNDIDLTGLGRGVYQLSFQDPYSCPADPGLQRSRTITPTDNEQPLITTSENLTLFVDPGNDCQRVITAQDFIDYNLKPTITDACDFTTTWRITPQATLIPQDFPGADFTGAVLELGQNRVDVTAIQYDGTVSSSAFYFITVEDDIPPVANGKSVSDVNLSNDYTPMGSGIVYYDAFGFDDGSQDNCSPVQDLTFELSYDGVIYSSELSFDKDDVNQEVTVYFRVTDAAGLSHVESGNTMTVNDIYDPVFVGATNKPYQACATVDGAGAVPASTIIPAGSLRLDASDYSDNVNILPENIEYMLDHESYAGGDTGWLEGDDPSADAQVFYEGVTSVWFRITDPSNNPAQEIIYTVTILPKPAPSGGIQ